MPGVQVTFIFWDGEECKDAGYCLFGASVAGATPEEFATYLQSPYLRTADMLDLLLSVSASNPGSSHVWFNGDYDINQILRELDWRTLITLKHKGKVIWHGYKIEHIPGKIFKVSKDEVSIRVDDCFSFFRCRFDKALRKWEIGNQEVLAEISEGKDSRDEFRYRDIDYIHRYWAKEVQYGCHLMTKVRAVSHGAGYLVNNWHGPGALAAYSLNSHDVKSLMSKSPAPVLSAALSAYAGGWFERFKMGRYQGDVYTYDINSAYVYAMSLLPDLANGRWSYVQFRDRDHAAEVARNPDSQFGLYHFRWRASIGAYLAGCNGVPFPLFHRENNGSIRRPSSTEGWIWGPEAAELSAIPSAELTGAWIYEHDYNRRPFAWVADDFDRRLELQRAGDPSEKILKWALASYYGRLAQRTGWNEKTRTAPAFHQIEWAGWITSKCRAMIYRVAMASARMAIDQASSGHVLSGESRGLVSVDTDGIISTERIPEFDRSLSTGLGSGLGQWKEEHFNELIYLQNGVYWLRGADGWVEPKLRGIPKAKFQDYNRALSALQSGEPVSFQRHGFTGYRQALQGDRTTWRNWSDHTVNIDFLSCGSRIHVPKLCRACKAGVTFDGGLHDLASMPATGSVSSPHKLPWLSDQSVANERYRSMILAEEML
jgi:hypothetical protein